MHTIHGVFAYHYAANPVDGEGNRVALHADGAAPPRSADGRVAIAFSGDAPAETLLHLYAAKGEAMAGDLKGAFALALWDAGRRALFLARDGEGRSPLFYTDDGWTLRFASEKGELLAGGDVSRAAEAEIRAVPAGCRVMIDALGPREAVRLGSGAITSAQMTPAHGAPRRARRVLALMTDGFGGHGGIAQYNRDFLTALAAMDDIGEVVVLPRCGDEHVRDLPPRVRQLPAVWSRVRYSARAIRLALAAGPFDMIFCGHLFMAPLGAVIAKALRAPMWLSFTASTPGSRRGGWRAGARPGRRG